MTRSTLSSHATHTHSCPAPRGVFAPRPARAPVAVAAVAVLCLCGCGAAGLARPVATLVSYNVQNLFDGIDDGTEYDEFRSDSGWTRDRYYDRLERVEEAVRLAAGGALPQVIALQEIESPVVAADIVRDFLRRHRYVMTGRAGHTTTQVVVLSRTPPERQRTHAVSEVVLAGESMRTRWTSRDMVDVTFARPPLRVVVAHWKSQSGGQAATAPKRLREARLVASLLEGEAAGAVGRAVLLVGDLNEDLRESPRHDGAWPTAWMRTLWDESSPGSYVYRGEWERLDHAFLLDTGVYAGSLRVGLHPRLLDERGFPYRYDPRTRRGYSDHLPIAVTLTRRQSP